MEASTRLDAIASAAFGLSRSKIGKLIDNEVVSIDWKISNNAASNIQVSEILCESNFDILNNNIYFCFYQLLLFF